MYAEKTNSKLKKQLLDADHLDQAQHFLVRHVVERAFVFFFEAFAQKFRGDETSFAVGEVTAALFTEFDESGIREADNAADSIHVELGVDGVAVAGGDGVPDVGEAAVINVAAQFRSHFKRADELVHGAGIREYRVSRHGILFFWNVAAIYWRCRRNADN